MPFRNRPLTMVLAAGLGFAVGGRGDEKTAYTGSACAAAVDDFFRDEVWAKVGARTCLQCHKPGGDAEESKFVLQDPQRAQGAARDDAVRHNRDAFARMARAKHKDQSR